MVDIEIQTAAQGAGTLMILSSLSTVSLEDVRAAAPGCLLWQQTYIFRNRSLTESLVKRAAACGFAAIVVTADSAVPGDGVLHLAYLSQLPHGHRYHCVCSNAHVLLRRGHIIRHLAMLSLRNIRHFSFVLFAPPVLSAH